MSGEGLVSWIRTKLSVNKFEEKYTDVNQVINDLRGIEKFEQVEGALLSDKSAIHSEITGPINDAQNYYEKSLRTLSNSSVTVSEAESVEIEGTEQQQDELLRLQRGVVFDAEKRELSQQIEADLMGDIEDAFNTSYDEGNRAAALQYFDERISSLDSQQSELEIYNRSAYRRIRSLISDYKRQLRDLPDT